MPSESVVSLHKTRRSSGRRCLTGYSASLTACQHSEAAGFSCNSLVAVKERQAVAEEARETLSYSLCTKTWQASVLFTIHT
jgi:hypothetical protein